MQAHIWDADTARRYDTPGTGMFAPEVLAPTVDRLAALAGTGPALEFAIGTGRVAVPLAQRGVPVTGIELSRPMVDQLRTKADEATIPVVIGDMATASAAGEYTLVYLVYNTISNLLTQAEQVECFRNAARHLTPGGRFVIELWVPELRKLPPGSAGHSLLVRSRLHRPGHVRRPAPAGRVASLPLRRERTGAALPEYTPLHLAG
jgi:SAM-dependent methyltransferase